MTPAEFIKNRLLEIKNVIKGISITYIYEKGIDYHTVIVEPSGVYQSDVAYKQWESRLIWDFYEKFHDLDILVTEKTPIIDIENVIFETHSMEWKDEVKPKYSFGFTNSKTVDINYPLTFSLAA